MTECEENRGRAKRTNSKCVFVRECILEERGGGGEGKKRREEKKGEEESILRRRGTITNFMRFRK